MNAESQSVVVGNAITFVSNEATKYAKLKEQLQAAELDEQCILDTLEGETNLNEALAEVAQSALEDEAMAEGLTGLIQSLQERKSRLEKPGETKRTLIIMAMETRRIEKRQAAERHPLGRATKPKLVVTDESLVPAQYFKPVDPVLDKAALKAALESLKPGKTIPGAELSNGGVSLTIRVK
jgi:hypothetical protein